VTYLKLFVSHFGDSYFMQQWKVKAFIQNIISLFPDRVSSKIYFYIQKKFGNLRSPKCDVGINAGLDVWKKILEQGETPIDKIFFELGTGRTPMLPLTLWLMGAKKIITVDLNFYYKKKMFRDCVNFLLDDLNRTHRIFDGYLLESRLNILCKNRGSNIDLNSIGIEYISPQDAGLLNISTGFVDYYVSHNVLEHIHKKVIKSILSEGVRVLSKDGMFIHRIDYSDHFSHSDKSISAINFLQYSDFLWSLYASNRFMYMNRIRHDDFLNILSKFCQNILSIDVEIDSKITDLLGNNQLLLDKQFRNKSIEILSITSALVVSDVRK